MLPAEIPVTVPELLILPIPVFVLLHVPPAAVSFSAVSFPAQTANVPVIIPLTGNGSTITVFATIAVPQLLVTL